MKFVVTGSTGFVGRNIVQKLLNNGYEVISVTTNNYMSDDILDYINGSEVLVIKSLNQIPLNTFRGNIILHCAWNNVQNVHDSSHFFHALEQLEFLKKVSVSNPAKLIVTGTCYEFGNSTGPISVSDVPVPNTPYGAAKDFVHKAALKIICEDNNIDFTWARLFYIYGIGQHKNSIYTQLTEAIQRGDKNFNMSLGEQLFDYMNISEVVDCLFKIATQYSPSVLHVCNGYPTSLRSLAEKIIEDSYSSLTLNLGYYPYRLKDSLAIWGAESFESQI